MEGKAVRSCSRVPSVANDQLDECNVCFPRLCEDALAVVLEEGEWVSNLLPVPLVLPKVGSNCVHAFPIVRDAVVVVVVQRSDPRLVRGERSGQ